MAALAALGAVGLALEAGEEVVGVAAFPGEPELLAGLADAVEVPALTAEALGAAGARLHGLDAGEGLGGAAVAGLDGVGGGRDAVVEVVHVVADPAADLLQCRPPGEGLDEVALGVLAAAALLQLGPLAVGRAAAREEADGAVPGELRGDVVGALADTRETGGTGNSRRVRHANDFHPSPPPPSTSPLARTDPLAG